MKNNRKYADSLLETAKLAEDTLAAFRRTGAVAGKEYEWGITKVFGPGCSKLGFRFYADHDGFAYEHISSVLHDALSRRIVEALKNWHRNERDWPEPEEFGLEPVEITPYVFSRVQ